jgi:hypothetical protein
MLVLLVLFYYCFIIITVFTSVTDQSIPIQCYINGQVGYISSKTENQESESDVGLVVAGYAYYVSWAAAIFYVFLSYIRRILDSYAMPSSSADSLGLISSRGYCRFLGLFMSRWSKLATASPEDWRYILREADAELWAEMRKRILQNMIRYHGSKSARSRNRWILAIAMYRRSFFPIVPSLALMLTYGFTQAVIMQWFWVQPLNVESTMGFGQITPLLLLVLPVLAAGEIYQGESMQTSSYMRTNDISESVSNNASLPPFANESVASGGSQKHDIEIGIYRSHSLPNAPSQSIGVSERADLNNTRQSYERQLHLVERYLYWDTKDIQARLKKATSEADYAYVLQKKRYMFEATEMLLDAERKLGLPQTVLKILSLQTFGAILLAVLLNMGHVWILLTGAVVMWWCFCVYLCFRLSKPFRLGRYLELLTEARENAVAMAGISDED